MILSKAEIINCFIQLQRKVEKILKSSLDLIPSPSPSVKIQMMGKKVCLRCQGKTLQAEGEGDGIESRLSS